jgi:hypothetical protein
MISVIALVLDEGNKEVPFPFQVSMLASSTRFPWGFDEQRSHNKKWSVAHDAPEHFSHRYKSKPQKIAQLSVKESCT